ncbi:PEP/pyruvate-binding domain-containing protein [Hellea sp.]|nr:PEP/pyruvate-binding domain-containing protein [Hellea sp.]
MKHTNFQSRLFSPLPDGYMEALAIGPNLEFSFAPDLEPGALQINPADGDTSITSRARFEELAHRDDVPGAIGVREVKYLITGVDTDSPQVYFLNTNVHKYHFFFARDVLGVGLSGREFNNVTYFTQDRQFLAGTIIAHDQFAQQGEGDGLYAMEFWPTDPVSFKFIALAYRLIREAVSFAAEKIAYHPSGFEQERIYTDAQSEFEAGGIRVILTDDIFKNLRYSPLNLGVGYGRLRIMDGANFSPPGITTVVLFKSLPNELSHVSGVLSETPQTPLSHVNLRAKQNNTPNAYMADAAKEPRIATLLDQLVRYEVKPDDIDISPTTKAEVDAFFENQRPSEEQTPVRNLAVTQIQSLDTIGHENLDAFGAKAANVAQLRKILPNGIVPSGFAVPFYFYNRFMSEAGLYAQIRTLRETPDFQNNEDVRDRGLKAFRKAIKRAPVPEDLKTALGQVQAIMETAYPIRCRSSTNNEDLEGFNGAGLYDSYTHRPDEGHLEKSIKQVWASLWNFRAYEEREFYRIDHFTTAMGVLLHRNFDNELANGVALTKNIYFPDFSGFYVNSQVGEALVTNPGPNAIAEELLIMRDAASSTQITYEKIRIRASSLVPAGETVLPTDKIDQLVTQMEIIQSHFKAVYGADNDPDFAMDIEFKLDADRQLIIKQARPWVD